MRYILIVFAFFALLASPALAQNSQSNGAKPKKVKIIDVGLESNCIWVKWKVHGVKHSYKIRVINTGRDALQLASVAGGNLSRGWMNAFDSQRFPPRESRFRLGGKKWKHVLCGLQANQSLRVAIVACRMGNCGKTRLSDEFSYNG